MGRDRGHDGNGSPLFLGGGQLARTYFASACVGSPAYATLDLADTYALFRGQGVDLSDYAGLDDVHAIHKLTITDSGGAKAVGWLGGQDAVESLGSELLDNVGFEVAGAGGADVFGTWNEIAGDGAIADEGVIVHAGSHAAKLTAGASVDTEAWQPATVTPGRLHKMTIWVRGDGTNAGRYYIKDQTAGETLLPYTSTGVIAETYAQITVYFTAPVGCSIIRVFCACPITVGGIAYFDDISVKPVNDAGVDAVHILDSVNVGSRGWESIESGFLPNDTAYTFTISRAFIGDFGVFWNDATGDYLLGQSSDLESVYLPDWSGLDVPPTDVLTETLAQYSGELYRGVRFNPRIFSLGVVRNPGADESDFWEDRKAFMTRLNPYKGEGLVRFVFVDGTTVTVRTLVCIPIGPFNMDGGGRRKTNIYQAGVQFLAAWPFFKNPVAQSAAGVFDGTTPVAVACSNSGNAPTFPTFAYAATVDTPKVQVNGEPSKYVEVEQNITSGYVTLTTDRGNKKAILSTDDSYCQMAAESRFFVLEPGSNTLNFSAASGTGAITVSWYEYYMGLGV